TTDRPASTAASTTPRPTAPPAPSTTRARGIVPESIIPLTGMFLPSSGYFPPNGPSRTPGRPPTAGPAARPGSGPRRAASSSLARPQAIDSTAMQPAPAGPRQAAGRGWRTTGGGGERHAWRQSIGGDGAYLRRVIRT